MDYNKGNKGKSKKNSQKQIGPIWQVMKLSKKGPQRMAKWKKRARTKDGNGQEKHGSP